MNGKKAVVVAVAAQRSRVMSSASDGRMWCAIREILGLDPRYDVFCQTDMPASETTAARKDAAGQVVTYEQTGRRLASGWAEQFTPRR